MARRLYIGKLSLDTRQDDIEDMFRNYPKLTECRVMNGFGFVEFENPKDAEQAVEEFHGKPFGGSNSIIVEFAKESRPRREPRRDYDSRGGGYPPPMRSRRPPGFRLTVEGVSRDVSWQDLKDFGREAGAVSFADLDYDNPGFGILEYVTREDAERAAKELDGKDLRGRNVRVNMDEGRGPDNYRRDDRGSDRGGDRERYRDERRSDDRYHGGGDRYRDDRRGDDRGERRRERSRSPPRRRSVSPRREGSRR